MPIYKRCSMCGKRIPSGSRCPCWMRYQKERYKSYDQYKRNRKSKGFYDSKGWGIARRTALGLDGGIDVYLYMTEGEIVRADTVHHIIPLKEARDKGTDVGNLISLSHGTHSKIEQMYRENKNEMIGKLQEMLREFRKLREAGGI